MENQSAPLPLMCKSADGGGQDAEKSHVSVQRQVPYAARLWCTAWRPRRPHVKPTRSGLSLMKTSDYPAQTGRRKARQLPLRWKRNDMARGEETRSSAVADKPRDAFMQTQRRDWTNKNTPSPHTRRIWSF